MNGISKKHLDEFIGKEASKIIFEEEDASVNVENTLESLESQKDELGEKIKAKNTLINAIKDRDEKISELKRLEVLKNNLKEVEANLSTIQQVKQQVDTIGDDDENNTTMDVVATTVTETVIDKSRQLVSAPVIRKRNPVIASPSVKSTIAPNKIKRKNVIIQFDKGTKRPFQVNFTQRGFLIGDTRLSFELLEKAISKKFRIVLKDGFVLDDIKMQKILRYKNIL